MRLTGGLCGGGGGRWFNVANEGPDVKAGGCGEGDDADETEVRGCGERVCVLECVTACVAAYVAAGMCQGVIRAHIETTDSRGSPNERYRRQQ